MRLSCSALAATALHELDRIPNTAAHIGGGMTRSAGDHEWRQIQVSIALLQPRATVSVHARKRRGTDRVWQRGLGAVGVELPDDLDAQGTPGVLRLAARELLEIAER